jgi:hypothetical protein
MKFFFLLIMLVGFGLHAQEPPDVVLERLAAVKIFAIGGIGFAGVRSQGEKDYRIILSRNSALSDFEKVYASGNSQAKAYALVGIHILDTKRFDEVLLIIKASNEEIMTERGCMISTEYLGAIAKQIQRGQYELGAEFPKPKK